MGFLDVGWFSAAIGCDLGFGHSSLTLVDIGWVFGNFAGTRFVAGKRYGLKRVL
jgi:hypothetical protein